MRVGQAFSQAEIAFMVPRVTTGAHSQLCYLTRFLCVSPKVSQLRRTVFTKTKQEVGCCYRVFGIVPCKQILIQSSLHNPFPVLAITNQLICTLADIFQARGLQNVIYIIQVGYESKMFELYFCNCFDMCVYVCIHTHVHKIYSFKKFWYIFGCIIYQGPQYYAFIDIYVFFVYGYVYIQYIFLNIIGILYTSLQLFSFNNMYW